MSRKEPSSMILVLIGLLKLFKAGLLILLGFGALHLMRQDDFHQAIAAWVHDIHVDPENHYIHALLAHLPDVSPAQLRALSVGTFIYAALFSVEGIGLVLRKRWAEYLVVVSTSLFLPLEIYEVVRHGSATRVIMLVINLAVVIYLIYGIGRHERAPGNLPRSQPPGAAVPD